MALLDWKRFRCRWLVWTMSLFLLCLLDTVDSQAGTIITGAVFSGEETFSVSNSPYIVTSDIIVERSGKLHIQPGTILQFSPGVGITVRGALIAVGGRNSRITMTRSTPSSPDSDLKVPNTVRLVDGPSILEGRLQVHHKNRWRSVCTNSRNWTATDLRVVCRELGFEGGYFHNWYPHNNDSSQLLYERPSCLGGENHLKNCQWQTRKLGSGVCDDHLDLGVKCDSIPLNTTVTNWRGLRFEYAVHRTEPRQEDQYSYKFSESYLSYVDIFYAGYNFTRNVTSAIESVGIPPIVTDLSVKWSAYNGINVTNPQAEFTISNTVVQHNRGYGVYVNSSTGMAKLLNCSVFDNGGDGVHYVHHDLLEPPSTPHDFCTVAQNDNQMYPMQLFARQFKTSLQSKSCTKSFYVNRGTDLMNTMTVHFTYLMSESDGDGSVEVRDGSHDQAPLILKFFMTNSSRPQSVTTTANSVWVKFWAKERANVFLSMELVAGKGKPYDLNVTGSVVNKNNGRGIVIENIRSLLAVQSSQVQYNDHVAGIHVINGSGDVNITSTVISDNIGDGVNISYAGGRRNCTYCTIRKNSGRGIAVWLNESSPYVFDVQSTVVASSYIIENGDVGVFVGNFCGNSIVNITQSHFNTSQNSAVEILSCWKVSRQKMKLFVTLNVFAYNRYAGLVLTPAVNLDADVSYNRFEDNLQGALYIRNSEHEELESLPANLTITENRFLRNRGSFAASIGVSQYSKLQAIEFSYNRLEGNVATEPFRSLNPRSRVAAVLTISSNNTKVYRNIFDNPRSRYDLGSHLQDRYSTISATHNWLGSTQEKYCYFRVFDSQSRYNLATINYMPYLLEPSTITNRLSRDSAFDYIPSFINGTEIGGEVAGEVYLEKMEYIVRKDIIVHPRNKLLISRGTTLKFDHSVGILVQGQMRIENGNEPSHVKAIFTLNSRGFPAFTNSSVRLHGNMTHTSGRLQVQVNGQWGTVCNYGWTMADAALACHQMGMVLNPADWLLELSEMPSVGMNVPILRSDVKCRDLDTDLTKCPSEGQDDFETSCTHDNDVGIKCHEQTWAGLHFGLLSKENNVENLQIDGAGILDSVSDIFQPALQIDMLNFPLNEVVVTKNGFTGIGVAFTSLYSDNTLRNCHVESNQGHGIATRSQGVWLEKCQVYQNIASGFHYNPILSRLEERALVNWLDPSDGSVHVLNKHVTLELPRGVSHGVYLVTPDDPNIQVEVTIRARDQSVLTVYVIGAIRPSSTEQLKICDGHIWDEKVEIDARRKLIVFPMTTLTDTVKMRYSSGSKPSGRAALYVVAVEGRPFAPTPTTRFVDSSFHLNAEGISVFHYNRYISEWDDRYLRVKNESFEIFHCNINDNRKDGILVTTPHREPLTSDIANITYLINETFIQSNEGGITQISRDIRNSNNIFHWLLGNNFINANKYGGIDLVLPYVWQQQTLNATNHTFMFVNNSFNYNTNFKFTLDGYYAKLLVRENNFTKNACKRGLILVQGMEKEIAVERNIFIENNCQFVVEFDINSHTDVDGFIPAYFVNNIIGMNSYIRHTNQEDIYQPRSSVLALRGVQKVNINYNLIFDNRQEYDLLAGIRTSSLDNRINVKFNYWGTTISDIIRKKIFDFDDWNSFAIADFSPFLRSNDFSGIDIGNELINTTIDLNNLGGRVNRTVTLRWRTVPYEIRSDITIMPGAILYIDPGVTLEFHPSVGILVLGAIKAIGHQQARITMRPIQRTNAFHYSSGRYRRQPTDQTVRLCHSHSCRTNVIEGFVEVYNKTTMQWIPLCDKQFTERNAEVVCSELGHEKQNVFIKFGPRLDIDPTSLTRVRTWPEPRQCGGQEHAYLDCDIRLNGNYKYVHSCSHTDDFVFVHCGARTLPKFYNYWGGIRISTPNFERKVTYPYDQAIQPVQQYDSVLEYVDIIGAGILHNEKSGAMQSTFNTPVQLLYVNVTHSASHGINMIAPSTSIYMNGNRVQDNLGVGINILVLNGDTGDKSYSSFSPIQLAHIPYNTFGLVDVCESHKALEVDERVLLYYRYHNHPVDCVKIFSSYKHVKPLGIRILQFNLFNSSEDAASPDILRIFDGDIYNHSSIQLGNLTGREMNEKTYFRSRGTTLSIQLHASGATEEHGFIAEIVTLPALPLGSGRNLQHVILHSEVARNKLGGAVYSSTGEDNPMVTFHRNQFKDTGIKMYGNFTSCEAAVIVDVRNTLNFNFKNNLLLRNQGGLKITAESSSTGSALKAVITNNLLTENDNRNALYFKGSGDVVQQASITNNLITRNYAQYEDNIHFKMVKVDFLLNYIYNNTGRHTLAVHGYEKLRLQKYQKVQGNSFHENIAQTPEYSGTILAGGTGQSYEENVLMNPYNNFEIVTTNRSSLDVTENRIDATNNWWGYNYSSAIEGRIRDRRDFDELLEVVFEPYYLNNLTIIDGECPPGWSGLGSTCFVYVGGVMTHEEAKKFCMDSGGSMPYVKESNKENLKTFIVQKQAQVLADQRVWVLSIDYPTSECIAFSSEGTERMLCDEKLPILCEKDPDIYLVLYPDTLTIAMLSVVALAILLVAVCGSFWWCKSRRRQKERLERRNSIRASKRSLRSISNGSVASEMNSTRRILTEKPKPVQVVEIEPYKGSIDSIEKSPSKFDSSSFFNSSVEDVQSYDICEATNHKVEYSDYDDKFVTESRPEDISYPPSMVNPSFDFGYDNKGFLENPYATKDESPNWCSSSGTESTADVKRYLETSLDTNGRDDAYTSRSTPSTFSQEYPMRRQILETDM